MTPLLLGFLITIVLLMGGFIMDAINTLNAAIAALRAKIDALVVPANHDAAIAAATDSVNQATAALEAKVTPVV